MKQTDNFVCSQLKLKCATCIEDPRGPLLVTKLSRNSRNTRLSRERILPQLPVLGEKNNRYWMIDIGIAESI